LIDALFFSLLLMMTSTESAAVSTQQQTVIDLTSESPPRNEWSCPQCTLLNPRPQHICNACRYSNPQLRPADDVRSERLIQDDSATAAFWGGYLQRSPPGRTGASLGYPVYPVQPETVTTPSRRRRRRQPRSSFRVTTQTTRHGNTTTTVYSPQGTFVQQQRTPPQYQQHANLVALLNILHNPNDNEPTYEQLLQTFGDGTDHMGADTETIAQLPTSTVTTTTSSTQDCAICLEHFCTGQERKLLPCLHGFHVDCIDRALRQRAVCPICNSRVE
jgi:hypothetical protein